jgi:phosphatidylglycerol---prolipoprotein diacylglyceryl transferase
MVQRAAQQPWKVGRIEECSMEWVNGALHVTATGPAVAFELGPLVVRWYSLAYLLGILGGWWYLRWTTRQPYAALTQVQADDFLLYATLGVVLGGRIGHILFYDFSTYMADPISMLKIWQGGMSFHGGVLGVTAGILVFARVHKLDWLRVHDHVAITVPIGLFLGRLANFANGELWGKPTDAPWGVVFATGGPAPRHPSQLYEAVLEGPVLFLILFLLFKNERLRRKPGLLVGAFILGYGVFRFLVEFVREPDAHLVAFAQQTGLHMGQWLCVPMILGGVFLVVRALRGRKI